MEQKDRSVILNEVSGDDRFKSVQGMLGGLLCELLDEPWVLVSFPRDQEPEKADTMLKMKLMSGCGPDSLVEVLMVVEAVAAALRTNLQEDGKDPDAEIEKVLKADADA